MNIGNAADPQNLTFKFKKRIVPPVLTTKRRQNRGQDEKYSTETLLIKQDSSNRYTELKTLEQSKCNIYTLKGVPLSVLVEHNSSSHTDLPAVRIL
jgi:hypothetical protein